MILEFPRMLQHRLEVHELVRRIVSAELEEVLDDPALNTAEYLEKRVGELSKLTDAELQSKGQEAKERKNEAEEEDLKEIRKKYFVD